MGAPSKFDVCEYGRAEGLFHCSESHEVLGVSHDHRCDEIRAKFRALADEVERLRKIWHIKRCDKLSNDDPSRRCRLAEGHEIDCDFGEAERLRAERAEVLALLEATGGYRATDCCDDDADDGDYLSEECLDETPCWMHRAHALVAKLRGAP